MASKWEFVQELDEQVSSLNTAFTQLSQTITANKQTVTELKQKRAARLEELIHSLLPDVEPQTVTWIGYRVPGFPSAEQVQQLLVETRSNCAAHLKRLLAEYDPESYASQSAALEAAVASARSDLADVKAPFDQLASQTRVTELVEARYGRATYKKRWYHPQYYRDWRDADEIVEKARLKDWDEVESQYTARAEAIATLDAQFTAVERKLNTLYTNQQSYEHWTAAASNVAASVLEQLGVKLSARLDSMDPLPEWMSDVAALNAQLAKLAEQTTALQQTLGKMTEQIAPLQKLRTQAAESGKRKVPDHYMDALRANRLSRTSTTVYVDNRSSDSLFDGMMYGQINNYFSEREAFNRGYDSGSRASSSSSYRDSTYSSAQYDRSGQS